MEENNEKKKKKFLDKVVMGAVIGGAIGSVLGATLAPKKGKETRKDIIDTAKKAKETSMRLIDKIKNFFTRKKQKQEKKPEQKSLENLVKEEDVKKIPTEVK